jgi:3-deoxy-D-manno-octulosonic-acid transferase
MMQSDEDAERISLIGAPSEKIIVSGNLKFDRNLHDDGKTGASADDLKAWLGPAQNGDMLIAAGSTHPGEEERLLEALHLIRQTPGLGRVRLLLAPRHPERSQEIATTIRQKSFTISRRSSWTRDGNAPPADILLLDTIGELAAAYQFADVVFIGGTLVDHGGHSIMEPAFYAKPIVTGPSMQNFRGIMDEFLAKRAIRQISARSDDPQQQTQELKEELHNLLTHEEERNAMGRAARSILERNSGAAQRTAEKIAACFVTTKGTKNTK